MLKHFSKAKFHTIILDRNYDTLCTAYPSACRRFVPRSGLSSILSYHFSDVTATQECQHQAFGWTVSSYKKILYRLMIHLHRHDLVLFN